MCANIAYQLAAAGRRYYLRKVQLTASDASVAKQEADMKRRIGQYKARVTLFSAVAVVVFTMLMGVAFAADSPTSATLTGGSLNISSALTAGSFSGTLTGAAQALEGTGFSGFSINDPRGPADGSPAPSRCRREASAPLLTTPAGLSPWQAEADCPSTRSSGGRYLSVEASRLCLRCRCRGDLEAVMRGGRGRPKARMALFCACAVAAFTLFTGVAFAADDPSISTELTAGTFVGILNGQGFTLNANEAGGGTAFSGFSITDTRGTGLGWYVTMVATLAL